MTRFFLLLFMIYSHSAQAGLCSGTQTFIASNAVYVKAARGGTLIPVLDFTIRDELGHEASAGLGCLNEADWFYTRIKLFSNVADFNLPVSGEIQIAPNEANGDQRYQNCTALQNKIAASASNTETFTFNVRSVFQNNACTAEVAF